MAAEDAREVVAIGEAAVGGDLFDAAVGQGKELRGVIGAGLLHVDGRRAAGVLLELADEDALAHDCAPGENGIAEVAGELAVQEAQDIVKALGGLGSDGNLEPGEGAVQ